MSIKSKLVIRDTLPIILEPNYVYEIGKHLCLTSLSGRSYLLIKNFSLPKDMVLYKCNTKPKDIRTGYLYAVSGDDGNYITWLSSGGINKVNGTMERVNDGYK